MVLSYQIGIYRKFGKGQVFKVERVGGVGLVCNYNFFPKWLDNCMIERLRNVAGFQGSINNKEEAEGDSANNVFNSLFGMISREQVVFKEEII